VAKEAKISNGVKIMAACRKSAGENSAAGSQPNAYFRRKLCGAESYLIGVAGISESVTMKAGSLSCGGVSTMKACQLAKRRRSWRYNNHHGFEA